MDKSQLITKIQAVRNALDDLETYLQTNNLPRITRTYARRRYNEEQRDALYLALGGLNIDMTYTTSQLQSIVPAGATANMLGRVMREMGWKNKVVRDGDTIYRKWVYDA